MIYKLFSKRKSSNQLEQKLISHKSMQNCVSNKVLNCACCFVITVATYRLCGGLKIVSNMRELKVFAISHGLLREFQALPNCQSLQKLL